MAAMTGLDGKKLHPEDESTLVVKWKRMTPGFVATLPAPGEFVFFIHLAFCAFLVFWIVVWGRDLRKAMLFNCAKMMLVEWDGQFVSASRTGLLQSCECFGIPVLDTEMVGKAMLLPEAWGGS